MEQKTEGGKRKLGMGREGNYWEWEELTTV